jgi:hypothetical protein
MFTSFKKWVKRQPFVWYYVRNRKYINNVPAIPSNLAALLQELRHKGIAKTNFSTLFPEMNWVAFSEEVYKAVAEYEKNGKFSEHSDKDYMNFVLGLNPVYHANSPWAKIAEHTNLQNLACGYFKLSRVDMRYYNVWKHEAAKGEAKGSQLWHRDREDEKILKMFICIEDVDDTRGPFTYAPGTHKDGSVKSTPRFIKEASGVHRTTDEMMDEIVPQNEWVKATGKKGDIILADTRGYHKGGFVKEGYRLLFTCMYVSPASDRLYFSNHL